MKYKTPVKLLASVFSLLFVSPLLIKSLGVSADVIEISKVSGSDTRAFYGDSLSVTYTVNGTPYSTFANYYTTYTSATFGANVGYNPLGDFSQYDVLVYTIDWSGGYGITVNNIQISGLNTYFPDYYRMGLAISSHDNNITASYNEFAVNTNYWGTFQAPTGNSQSSANLINYFGMMYPPSIQGYSPVLRPIFIQGDEGGYFDTVHFNSIKPNSYGSGSRSWFYIFCPYVGETMSNTEPSQTTVTTGTNPPSSSIDINVSVYVDNSQIESQLDEYLGADDTRITTYETINLGTFPTFDYNNATETVNISQVVSETGDGINSIWYLISGLFSSVPLLVWLVPFCIFMSIMSFVLWRKGG